MFAKPNQVLAQQSQYLLAVNNSILDNHQKAVQAAVLNLAGGTSVAVARLSPVGRPLAAEYLMTITSTRARR
jgi:hypothetical protein